MIPEVHTVNTRDAWQRVQWMLRAADYISFDVETTSSHGGLEDWHDDSRIVSVAFAVKHDEAWCMPLAHPQAAHGVDPAEVFDTLVGHRLVGHNVKFDARWVYRTTGVDLSSDLAWDTQAAAYLQDENRETRLKFLGPHLLGVPNWDDHDAKVSADTVPLDQLARYNGLDAAYTLQLCDMQRDELRDDPLGRLLWFVLMPAIRALCSIEQEGMLLDVDYVREAAEAADQEIRQLERDLVAMTPEDLLRKYDKHFGQQSLFADGGEELPKVSWAPTSLFFLEYAERAGWPVLATSEKTKKPAWGKAVLKQVAARGFDDARLLMRQRVLKKQHDAFLVPWSNTSAGARLYPTYRPNRHDDEFGKESGTATGRTSCSGPNLQQVPRPLKPSFVAPEGWSFLQADASQIEVRIVAHTSGDPNLVSVYQRNGDVYRETAAGIRGIPVDEVTPEDRQRTKPVVLGFLYGMGSRSFVEYARDTFDIVYTEDESAEVRQAFFDLYPGLLDWHERTRRLVRRQGFITSPLGRIRRVPEAMTGDRQERGRAERQAINAEIQSFASDIMLMALARVRDELHPEDFRSCGTVHDSLLGYVGGEADMVRTERIARRIGEIMVTPPLERFGVDLSVPLVADIEYGPAWGKPEHEITVRSSDEALTRAEIRAG